MFNKRKHAPPQKRIDGLIGAGTVVHGDVVFTGGLGIYGTVKGPIAADDSLELQAKARVVGDVTYRTLEMHLRAAVQGRLHHDEPATGSVVELKRASAD